jgi:hypothetical protein
MIARLIVLAALCCIGFVACFIGYSWIGAFLEIEAKERWPERRWLIGAVSWTAICFPGLALAWLCGGLTVGGGQ